MGIDQELAPEQGHQLAGVHFRDQDPFEPSQQIAEILRHRPDVTNVNVRHVKSFIPEVVDGQIDGTISGTPTDNSQPAFFVSLFDGLQGNVVGDAVDLGGAHFRHPLVIGRII